MTKVLRSPSSIKVEAALPRDPVPSEKQIVLGIARWLGVERQQHKLEGPLQQQ